MSQSNLSAFRAYAASQHYAVALLVQAVNEDAALALLDEYCRVELLARAQVDIILDTADADADDPIYPGEYIYWPHQWLMPYRGGAALPAEPVTVLARTKLNSEEST